jgi:hypothetical protein
MESAQHERCPAAYEQRTSKSMRVNISQRESKSGRAGQAVRVLIYARPPSGDVILVDGNGMTPSVQGPI